MRLHRFIGDFDFSKETLHVTDKELVSQLKNVLRLKTGDQAVLADGKLNEATVKIMDLGKDSAAFEIIKVEKNALEPAVHVILYCSVLKKENFELVVQKATEVGAKEIVPIIASRTVKLNLKKDRLDKIVKEAAEQSGRGLLPSVSDPLTFAQALEHAKDNHANLFLEPGHALLSAERVKHSLLKQIGVFIGPEGGWDEKEIEAAQNLGFKIVGLGGPTLRAETAAIIASYLTANAANF